MPISRSVKTIGILSGQETTFPQAFVDRVNQRNVRGIRAEFVAIDKVLQGEPTGYTVILDRISQDVPFYRSWLKHAAIAGAAVINNPFWWSADEKFVNNELAIKTGVPVPRTALLPSYEHPDRTTDRSFRNLAYPFDWDSIFAYTGFPAYMKPYTGGGWRDVHRVLDREDCFAKHAHTGQQVMLLQEEINFDEYYRCYCIGGKYVRIMAYDPRLPQQERYEARFIPTDDLWETLFSYTLKLNQYLGYDFNTVEFALRDGIPYAIDFCNPAPDADVHSIGEAHFEWVVETAAAYAIERAQTHKARKNNLTWGAFLQQAAQTPQPVKKKAKVKKREK